MLLLIVVLTLAAACARGQDIVSFRSGNLQLKGVLYKPTGSGPFPAVLYNHGSGRDPSAVSDELGPLFRNRGWVFFMPHRRGQGLSSSAAPFIGDQIAAADSKDGILGASATMVRLLETDHLNDQMAALAWLRTQSFVQQTRIAVAGNSFGGVQVVLGAERGSYCAAIDSAGGAQSWSQSTDLQKLMTRAVRNSRVPIFFFQAENDYDLSPSRVLAAAMKDGGKPTKLKIYPPFGDAVIDGHTFGYFGSSVWANDVFGFLDSFCGIRER